MAPIVMIRRGALEVRPLRRPIPTSSTTSRADPDELVEPRRRAADHAETVAAFREEVAAALGPAGAARGGAAKASAAAASSTRRCARARRTSWDYQPPRDAAAQYVRNHMRPRRPGGDGALSRA